MDRDKMNRGGARILVRVGDTLHKISYMNSTKALYSILHWRRQNFGSKGETLSKMYSSNTFEKFIRNLHKN